MWVIAYFGVNGYNSFFCPTKHEFHLNFQLRTTTRSIGNHPKFDETLMNHAFLFKVDVKVGFNIHSGHSSEVIRIYLNASIIGQFKESSNYIKTLRVLSDPEYYFIKDYFLKHLFTLGNVLFITTQMV